METDMNVSSFRALFSPLVLCVWGVVMLDIVFTGKIRTLLHPAFYPWVAITGASLLLVSIALVFTPGALHPEPWLTWFGRGGLLLVPILFALGFAPSTYSSYTVVNRGLNASSYRPPSAITAGAAPTPDSSVGKPLAVDVPYILSSTDADDNRKLLDGKSVELIGQLYPANAGEFDLVRLLIYCCAADASPISVRVKGDASSQKSEDWVDVTGVVRFTQKDGQWTPYLDLQNIKSATPPADPFLY